jgi:acyl-CoA synthetase (AMP-forming)/AMP-acid ligase II
VNLHTWFSEVAQRHARKTAIVHEQTEASYEQLRERSGRLRARLAGEVGERGVLGLCIEHPIDFVVVYLAAAAAEIKIVLIDPRSTQHELRDSLRLFELTHLICAARRDTAGWLAHAAGVELGGRTLTLGELRPELTAAVSHYRDGDFVVHGTSGTTGKPKGIVLSDDNIVHRVHSWTRTLRLTSDDVILCSLTLSHCHGIDVLMLPGLLNGCRVVAPDLDRISPRRICRLFGEHGVTMFSSLPYFYELMLETVAPDAANLQRLRYLISGSAPLSDRTARAFRGRFGRGIQQVYGLSEIGAICLNHDAETVGSIGQFIDGVKGQIVDAGTGDGSGELVVTGKALARGYLNSPDAEQQMFRRGWLWTQDLVTTSGVGLRIVGRRSRFINSGGNKVDPVELEDVLRTHPAVQEAVVTSRPDPLRTERIVAYLRLRAAASRDELGGFLRERLAAYKIPDELHFVDHIPKNSLGKVQLGALVDRHLPPASAAEGGA